MLSTENDDGFSTIYLTLTPYGIKLVLPNMSRHTTVKCSEKGLN
jgi:hypothetical protein